MGRSSSGVGRMGEGAWIGACEGILGAGGIHGKDQRDGRAGGIHEMDWDVRQVGSAGGIRGCREQVASR